MNLNIWHGNAPLLKVYAAHHCDELLWDATCGEAVSFMGMDSSRSPLILAALIQGRRSIRSYRPDPITPEVLEAIIDSGRWAPSPHHSLPFRFAVLTGQSAKEQLSDAMSAQWQSDLATDGVPRSTIEQELGKSRRRLSGAPAIVVGCVYLDPLDSYPDPVRQQAEHTMAAHALGAALQNMMLTAHAHDIGSAWMCAPLFCPDTVRRALILPESWIPHALLTLGHPAREAPPGARPPLEQIIQRFP